MKNLSKLALMLSITFWIAGCGESPSTEADNGDGTHTHADGTVHSNDEHANDAGNDDHDHGEIVALEPATIGDIQLELGQGHGPLQPGEESHLVVKLPYNDNGQSIIRAWIGTEDRTLSMVGKGEYAPSHDDYDIHAMAPSPLPENAMWWIEIESPDGTKVVGSTKPITE